MSFKVTAINGLNYRGTLSGSRLVEEVIKHTLDSYDADTQYPVDTEGNELALSATIPDGTHIIMRERQAEDAVDSDSVLVYVGKLGQSEVNFEMPKGSTVADALSKAGFDDSGTQLFMNNEQVSPSTELTESPARISLVGRVKGGC